MDENSSALQELVTLCEASLFRHKEELLSGLKFGNLRMNDLVSSVPAKRLLNIYSRRVKHLGSYISDHGSSIREDVVELCKGLEKHSNDQIKLWIVPKDNIFNYAIFSSTESKFILGCVFSADKRSMTEDEWEKLWGEKVKK